MNSLTNFALKNKYAQVKKLRSRLHEMNALLDWDAFLALFPDEEIRRGPKGYDFILKLKCLFLQSWHSISDEELEYQINDRFSFQEFLDFPDKVPDYTTIWRFREELTNAEILEKIWTELQRQISEHGIEVKEGTIQDARFIKADPGKKNSGMEDRQMAKTSRSRDGTWGKKNNKGPYLFGFKLHAKVQRGSKFIKDIAITGGNVSDNTIDLAKPDDIIYRDKAYTGTKTRAKGNGSMKRGKLTVKQKLRNKRIQKKRAEGEHPFGTMDRSFKAGRTKLTTIPRVYVQQAFVCMAYNIHRLRFFVNG